jgi:hypothetical protein
VTRIAMSINFGPGEDEHRAAEKRFWERRLRLSKWLNRITAGAAIIALGGLFFVQRSIEHANQGTVDAN